MMDKKEFQRQVLRKLNEWEHCKGKFLDLAEKADANLKAEKSFLNPIWLLLFLEFRFVVFMQKKIITSTLSRPENISYLEKSYELLKDHYVKELFSLYENADVCGEDWDNSKFAEHVTDEVYKAEAIKKYGLDNDPILLGTICYVFLEIKKDASKSH